jgi:hypothetical protein
VSGPRSSVRRVISDPAAPRTLQTRAARFRSAFVSVEQAGQVHGIGRAAACGAMRHEVLSFEAPTYDGMVVAAVPPA